MRKLIIIFILASLILVSGCIQQENPKGMDNKSCTLDSDCVPASCCHATDVVNKKYAPNCVGIACTLICQTTLDCWGKPVCINNTCEIQSTR